MMTNESMIKFENGQKKEESPVRRPKYVFQILIPTFNSMSTIRAALNSVVGQTFTDWVCVVLDDCSEDGTYGILQEYVSRFPNRFRVGRLEKRVPTGEVRNMLIAESSRFNAPYTLWLDSDDTFGSRETFQRIYNRLKQTAFPDLLQLSYTILLEDGTMQFRPASATSVQRLSDDGRWQACWSKCVKTKLLAKFDPALFRFEDTAYHFEILEKVRTVNFYNDGDKFPAMVYKFKRASETIATETLVKIQGLSKILKLDCVKKAFQKTIEYWKALCREADDGNWNTRVSAASAVSDARADWRDDVNQSIMDPNPKAKESDFDVVVAFTSHGERLRHGIFISMAESIFNQKTSCRIKIVMTLFKDDLKDLSKEAKQFITSRGIDLITGEENLRPHLKYFYAMQKYREHPVITVDDDCIYEDTLVESLMREWQKYRNCVLAKRVHGMTYTDAGVIKPYNKWIFECRTMGPPSFDLCATGVGGVLYPPDILKLSYDDLDVIELSLTNDDLFLRKKETSLGIRVKYVPPKDGFRSYKNTKYSAGSEALCLTDNIANNNRILRILNFSRKDLYDLPIFKPPIPAADTSDSINVVYITDDKYIQPTLVSIASLKAHRSERSHEIHVICDTLGSSDLSKLTAMNEPGFHVSVIKTPSQMFAKDGVNQVNNVSKSAIYKFFLADLLPHLNKVLYLDGDTLVLDSIDSLYNTDINEDYCAAVKDYKINMEYKQQFFKKIVSAHGGYFNSGVLLLNLYLIRKNKICAQLLDYRRNGINFFMDQDALNVKFRGHVKWLPPKFNFIASNFLFDKKRVEGLYGVEIPNGVDSFDKDMKTRPVIFHITGVPKPWNDSKSPAAAVYAKYAKMLESGAVKQSEKEGSPRR